MMETILLKIFVIYLGTQSISHSSKDVRVLPQSNYFYDLPKDVFLKRGDIYLGVLAPVSLYSSESLCGETLALYNTQFLIAFGLQEINNNKALLPNITLGIISLDNCYKELTNFGQGLNLLVKGEGSLINHLNVPGIVGIIGPARSSSVTYVAGLFNFFHIPMISPSASVDELRDRGRYGNFFRVVPPDSYQTMVMVDVLALFNWTYVSIVYEESSYGFNLLTNIKKHARDVGICIANSHGLGSEAQIIDYDFVVSHLIKDQRAKIVLLLIIGSHTRMFLEAAERKGTKNMFVYFLSDGSVTSDLKLFGKVLEGALRMSFQTVNYPGVEKYINNLSPLVLPEDPWLMKIWEERFGCNKSDSYDIGNVCRNKTVADIPEITKSADLELLALDVYAQAIDKLVRENCPEAFIKREMLDNCLSPGLLIEYLTKSHFQSPAGMLSFDEHGAMVIGYEILQASVEPDGTSFISVGTWKPSGLSMSFDKIRWMSHSNMSEIDYPQSICSLPCNPGEFLVQGELTCCWECFRCRDNEYVSKNGTSCSPCPYTYWPDQETFLDCVLIKSSFLWWTDKYGMALTALAGLGIIVSIGVTIIMIMHKNKKVIRGSNINMMLVINLGLFMMFTNVLIFIAKPNYYVCLASRIGFNWSCTLVFVPLLVKTNRLYQIFSASSKLRKVGCSANGKVTVLLTAVAIAIEMLIIAVCAYMWPIDAKETMPVLTTRYVELSCEQDMIGLIIPLCYNILILLICCIFAFLTRALPDNFNESWYILLSVSATLFVWMAFLPTYFSAFYASHKVALLGLALVLNGLITIVCFFATKFYALFFIDEKDIKITNFNTQRFEGASTNSQNNTDNEI